MRKPKTVLYRRKRERKTNYTRRLKMLVSRKSRLVVRFTNKKVIAQIISFTPIGDKVLVGVDSSALKELGWNYSGKSFPASYLTGLLLGKKAIAAGQKDAILDSGFRTARRRGKIFAFLKGVLDAGLEVPHSEDIFPSEERISGKHIVDYAASLDKPEERFGKYLKSNAKPEQIVEVFNSVKEKIQNGKR